MKHMIKLPAIVLGLMLLLAGTTEKVMAQDEDISMQSFYDELSPYGTWIQDPQYGYVWRPDVEQREFRPYYTNGRWAMTEYGNTWVSNYDWGWAPFHYGRWVYNRYNQWVWIPDTTWGPAWVSWRSGGGYYGWAPMGPGMNINVNINIPNLWWVFVPQRNIYYNSFPHYYSRRNVVIFNQTTIINNTYVRNNRYYSSGPRITDIRRYTGRDVPVYTVNRTARPSRSNFDGNRVNIYSPSRGSRTSNTAVVGPRESVRGEGYATARPDRATQHVRQGNTNDRASRTNERVTASRESVDNRSARDIQQAPPQREQQQRVEATTQARPERASRQEQPSPQVRQEQPQPQQRQEQPQQRQAQPQRSESRPEVQRAPQRIERSAPARSSSRSEGRGSSSSSRSSRSGRG